MYAATLDELERLQRRDISSAEYFANILQHAAELSPTDAAQFVDLVHMAFSAPRQRPLLEFARRLGGAGPHEAGSLLESIYCAITRSRGGETGFNRSIVDSNDANSTVTHHFGEFLMTGFARGAPLAALAAVVMDPVYTGNFGDLRSSFFASQVGSALARGELTPAEAVSKVTREYMAVPLPLADGWDDEG